MQTKQSGRRRRRGISAGEEGDEEKGVEGDHDAVDGGAAHGGGCGIYILAECTYWMSTRGTRCADIHLLLQMNEGKRVNGLWVNFGMQTKQIKPKKKINELKNNLIYKYVKFLLVGSINDKSINGEFLAGKKADLNEAKKGQ